MKSLLLALSLFSVSSVALAQSAGQSVSQPLTAADTLITLSEEDLMRAVRAVAEARIASESQQQTKQTTYGLTAEDLRLVKLQMLLSALGLGGVAPVQQPMPYAPAGSVNYTYAPQAAPQVQPQVSNSRLDRLEQLMLLLLQRRDSDRDAIVLPARSKGQKQTIIQQPVVDNSSSDSLLRELQQELVALRAAQQAQPAQQPQVIIQQPAPTVIQQPAPTVIQQPLQPEVQTKTEVRTDTVVVSYFKRQVFFAVGKSDLLPEARLALNEVYRVLAGDPDMKLYLTGYASPEGNALVNERLSQRRSQAVLDYLIACGISPDRLISIAGGVDRNTDLKSSARRVDIELKK
ncbi:MAG: OmpA family protein [Porphyromonas sp.]|uniref:OmpA family protein n=1 Tax=Porphyromonas sp. TaxID=1924944 RepID=UPI001CB23351|nr:OmpA family protein [Porphyromonas sp.]MBF1266321.1 OmpA family protein [Porphyromonadaceae bacterium]MBF1370833.1 OmpA family protein [Porphyromonas sp.]